jgi:hypothetical protein
MIDAVLELLRRWRRIGGGSCFLLWWLPLLGLTGDQLAMEMRTFGAVVLYWSGDCL